MKKMIVIPDSFKGTLSAREICDVFREQALSVFPDCMVKAVPVADGGEGTVDCFMYALGSKKQTVTVTGPFRERLSVDYTVKDKAAILEMAACAGLPLAEGRLNPEKTTTYGVGEIIADAVREGCTEILLGLGGSCTSDGGCGMAAALGVKFLDASGREFIPTGGTLGNIERIDADAIPQKIRDCKITAMCDVDNPVFGENGAAFIFAPQKGADPAMVKRLDQGLRHLSGVIRRDLGKDVCEAPGAGAAGAMGAGILAFLGGDLKPGIEAVLDMVGYDDMLEGTDVVFTGEGMIDSQSLRGKVISGVAKRAKKKNVPVVAVVGSVGAGAEEAYDAGISAIFSINRRAEDFEISRYKSKENLAATVKDILRFWKCAERNI